jgi:protein TonB
MRSMMRSRKPLWLIVAATVAGCNVEVNVHLGESSDPGGASTDTEDRSGAVAPHLPPPASPQRPESPPPPVVTPAPGQALVRDALWRPWLDDDAARHASEPCAVHDGDAVPPRVRDGAAAAQRMQALYPPLLREAGIGGTARVCILVGTGGRVLDAEVIESSGYPALDEAAERAAYEIGFIPAMRDDEPAAAWLALPLTFRVR